MGQIGGLDGAKSAEYDAPPPSKMPSRMRTPRNVSKLWTQALPIVTAPKAKQSWGPEKGGLVGARRRLGDGEDEDVRRRAIASRSS